MTSSQSTVTSKSSEKIGGRDFLKIHEINTRRKKNGRNPKSLPRNSELWHIWYRLILNIITSSRYYHVFTNFSRETSERVNRVRKGHTVWDILDEYEKKDTDTKDPLEDFVHHKSKPIFEEVIERFKIVHGIKIDLDVKSRINYGSLLTVLNYNDEILCVTEDLDIMIKSLHSVLQTDNIVFRC